MERHLFFASSCLLLILVGFSSVTTAPTDEPKSFGPNCLSILTNLLSGTWDSEVFLGCLGEMTTFVKDSLGLIKKVIENLADIKEKIGDDTDKGDKLLAELRSASAPLMEGSCLKDPPKNLQPLKNCISCADGEWKVQEDATWEKCNSAGAVASGVVSILLPVFFQVVLTFFTQ